MAFYESELAHRKVDEACRIYASKAINAGIGLWCISFMLVEILCAQNVLGCRGGCLAEKRIDTGDGIARLAQKYSLH